MSSRWMFLLLAILLAGSIAFAFSGGAPSPADSVDRPAAGEIFPKVLNEPR